MAMAIVWGLGFSTILTLLLVPALYMINLDIQNGLDRLFSGRRRESEESKPRRVGAQVAVDITANREVPEASGARP
jgi:hypothetical protein